MKALSLSSAIISVLLGLLININFLHAQEEQVFWDAQGTVLEIDGLQAKKAGLFAEYTPLISASIYRFSSDEFIIEITYEKEGRRLRERLPRTGQEVGAMRASLALVFDQRIGRPTADKSIAISGKVHYLLNTSIAAFGIYGPALPLVFQVNKWESATGLYMLTAGAGFLTPLLTSQNKTITAGMARMHGYGTTRGFMHGISLGNLLSQNDDRGRLLVGLGATMSFAESLAGYHLAKKHKISRHQAATYALGGDIGSVVGLAMYGILGDQDDFQFERMTSLLTLAGSAGGLILGHQFAQNNPYTVGDTRVMRTGGLLGASFGLYMIGMVRPETTSIRGFATTELLTGVAGLIGTHYLIKDANYTGGEGILVGLGTVAGGALGFGVGLLSDNTNWENGPSRFLLTSTMLGTLGGFLATTYALRNNSENDDDMALEIGLAPEAMMGLMPGIQGRIDPMGRKGNAIVQAGIRF